MITLYDFPSKVADSPGTMITWRTRYCLNLENFPYQIVYVEIPDIEALTKKIGAALTGLWPFSLPSPMQLMKLSNNLRSPLFDADMVMKMDDWTTARMKERFARIYTLKAPEGEEREKMRVATKENLRKMNKWIEGCEGDWQ
ncbi:hypothetical protein EV421DRAFT_1834932 [Armillaria borealis]|uniref:Uncharacterized protein n=1 Tax=Armillaria borealis TaxID=47425 RepID=A0AA39MIK6_9AGAR|nr:hypothetical protein EV421DRAFT_1834932 [Armillaria borealis]